MSQDGVGDMAISSFLFGMTLLYVYIKHSSIPVPSGNRKKAVSISSHASTDDGGLSSDLKLPSPQRTTVDKRNNIRSYSNLENMAEGFVSPNKIERDRVGGLMDRIDTGDHKKPLVIGVAGGTASGKTTLSKAIYQEIGPESITVITHDAYYKDLSHLPLSEREVANFDHPDSLDTALLIQHIQELKNSQPVRIPTYDYSTHSRLPGLQDAIPRNIILVEGILIFDDPELVSLMDIKVFVDTEDDIRLARRLQRDTVERGRDVASVLNQYLKTVRPMHMQFVEPSKRNADIIVPTGLNSVALDLVVSKLKYTLSTEYSDTSGTDN